MDVGGAGPLCLESLGGVQHPAVDILRLNMMMMLAVGTRNVISLFDTFLTALQLFFSS